MIETRGRTGLFSANEMVSPRKLVCWFEIERCLVTWGAGFRWEELESKELQIQEAWRELRWRQAGRSLNESGERPIWNVGSEEVVLVEISCEGKMVGHFSLSSILPFNKQTLKPWGTGVNQAQHPLLMGILQSRREGRHPEIHALMALES